jgi:pyruvate kinase
VKEGSSVKRYQENLLTKTKIVATVGPACEAPDLLRQMMISGVDVFRLNFAHGSHAEMSGHIAAIRQFARELDRSVGILGDLSGPKIRLGALLDGALQVEADQLYAFVRTPDPDNATALTTTYEGLIDDLRVGDPVLLADGTVSLHVVEKHADRAVCITEQPGLLRSGQGVNLPGVDLRVASITEKDRTDLVWAVEQGLDFIGLSFVRSAKDIRELRQLIAQLNPQHSPFIVAKIEKPEAVADLDAILEETDAVMVARGDLGVEVDIVRVPALQKQIISACNRRRVPVITATQMLDSMQHHRLPTRAEASDVANAVLDGSDAVMLSGETAIGKYPVPAVTMMSRIIREAEPFISSHKELPIGVSSRNAATELTRAVTLGAINAAEQLAADLIVVLTRGGKTAIAVSELRSSIPIIAVTDSPHTARRLSLAWGVRAVVTDVCQRTPRQLGEFVTEWGRRQGILDVGRRFVLVGTTDWTQPGKDLMLVHTVP